MEAGEPEPEPEAVSYAAWPCPSPAFVLCNATDDSGAYIHGEDAAGRVQPCSFRPTCIDCEQENVVLVEDFAPPTIQALLQAKSRGRSTIRTRECFNPACSGTSRRAFIDMRCEGEDAEGNRCRARASSGDCVILPQVLPAAEGTEDNVMMTEMDVSPIRLLPPPTNGLHVYSAHASDSPARLARRASPC